MTDEDNKTDKTKTEDTPKNADQDPEQEPVAAAGTDELAKVRHEAAGYRRKLREAEAERDQAREQIGVLRRAEVERALSERLADPQDLLSGVEGVDQFFTEEGKLDPEAVKREADAVLAEKPHWRKPAPDFDGGAREPAPKDRTPSFGEAIKRATG